MPKYSPGKELVQQAHQFLGGALIREAGKTANVRKKDAGKEGNGNVRWWKDSLYREKTSQSYNLGEHAGEELLDFNQTFLGKIL